MKPLAVLIAAAAFFSFALAGQEAGGPAELPLTDKATIVLFREHRFFEGDAYWPFINLDGRKIRTIHDRSWFSIDVGAGKHEITAAAPGHDPASIDVITTAGQTVYLHFEIPKNFVNPIAGKFVQVDSAQAQAEIAKLRRLPVNQEP